MPAKKVETRGAQAIDGMIRFRASAFGVSVSMVVDDLDLAAAILPSLPPNWERVDDEAEAERRYHVGIDPAFEVDSGVNVLRLEVNGEAIARSADLILIRDRLESDLHHYIATETRTHLFVHAGVVALNDRAIVIPGRSFTGKSTLVRELVARGANYYSDDYAVIDESGLAYPFPRQLRMRTPEGAPGPLLDPAREGWRVGSEAVPVGLVALLRYDPSSGWDIETVSAGAGVLGLLGNTVAARLRPADSLATMAAAIGNAQVIAGTRGEADRAAERLIEMLE
jgi:hypothetical protein